MTTRARDFLDRSRGLLDRSRAAAAEFLGNQLRQGSHPGEWTSAPVQTPPATRTSPDAQETEGALAGICGSLALRDLNLVDALLSQLEGMEAGEEDQNRLAELYRLDHLTTRLRRNAENLRVLSGKDNAEVGSASTSLVDAIRAGMSSIDHYARVTIGRTVALGLVGFAAEDVSRLLAELLDNATSQSPPDSRVRISAHLTESGSVLIRIEDDGIGLPEQRLAELNERLHAEPVLDDVAVRHMGLAVVRRIATRHGLSTNLQRRTPHGTTATVLLPPHVICELAEDGWSGQHTVAAPRTSRGQQQPPAQPRQWPGEQDGQQARHAAAERAAAAAEAARPTAPSAQQASSSTTPSGLPRRVSRSIRNSDAGPQDAMSESDTAEGHAKLLADLDAFSTGQQQARDGAQETTNGTARHATPGSEEGPHE